MFSFSGLVSAYLYYSAQVSVQVSAHFYTFQRILQVAFSPLWLLFKLIYSSFSVYKNRYFRQSWLGHMVSFSKAIENLIITEYYSEKLNPTIELIF